MKSIEECIDIINEQINTMVVDMQIGYSRGYSNGITYSEGVSGTKEEWITIQK